MVANFTKLLYFLQVEIGQLNKSITYQHGFIVACSMADAFSLIFTDV